jgi:transcriptional regulator with XRE-family HTH domain
MAASSVTYIDGTPFKELRRLIAAALRQARLLLGWTQVDLARAIKVTPVSISSFETGRTTRLRPRNERRILAALTERGIDVEGSAIRLCGRRQAAAD